MHDIGLSDVKTVMTTKGYQIFTDGKPNIVGIRNAERNNEDYFNDLCWVWWADNGKEIAHNYTITTHPGNYYLQNPIAGSNGTAILVPGQYINCWELGMHRGKQFALCQRAGEVRVYRDNNKDTILNCDPATITHGFYGIDLHNAGLSDPEQIGPWSAGCNVWRYEQAHEELMQDLKTLSEKYGFDKFSYTLLLEEEFN